MRKISIQIIINIIVIIAFGTYAILFGSRYGRYGWVPAYLVGISIIALAKYLQYRQEPMLYFALLFASYFVLVVCLINDIDILLGRYWGAFIVLAGLVQLVVYVRYRQMYMLRCGILFSLVGCVAMLLAI